MRNDKESRWLNARVGNFTASQIYKLMGKGKDGKVFSDGATTYIYSIVAEMLTGDSASSDLSGVRAIEWGNNHEKEALEAYKVATGIENINYFGKEDPVFFPLDDLPAGGSPDAIIEIEELLLEIKCPYTSENHIRYKLINDPDKLKEKHLDYYTQIQMNMIVTNTQKADFISYDPRFIEFADRIHILRVPQDRKFCTELRERINKAIEVRNYLYNTLKDRRAS